MYVPLGLLSRLLNAQRDEQQASDMAVAAFEHDQSAFDATSRELWEACTGPSAGAVVLGGNDWSEHEMDHVRVGGDLPSAAARAGGDQGYRAAPDVLGPGPHGYLAVCPGLHGVSTVVGGRRIVTTFVLFPGEATVLRLDRTAGAWAAYDPGETELVLARLSRRELALHDYSQAVAAPRVRAQVIRAAETALRECMAGLSEVLAAVVAGDELRTVDATRRASAALVGAPLRSFEPITSFLGFHAFDLVGKGRRNNASRLLGAGLALLPNDPTLLASLGELQLRDGRADEGRANLTRALGREVALDERLRERVRGLLAGRG